MISKNMINNNNNVCVYSNNYNKSIIKIFNSNNILNSNNNRLKSSNIIRLNKISIITII